MTTIHLTIRYTTISLFLKNRPGSIREENDAFMQIPTDAAPCCDSSVRLFE